jgi:hypothetical protein
MFQKKIQDGSFPGTVFACVTCDKLKEQNELKPTIPTFEFASISKDTPLRMRVLPIE